MDLPNPNAFFICVNPGQAFVPKELQGGPLARMDFRHSIDGKAFFLKSSFIPKKKNLGKFFSLTLGKGHPNG